MLPLDPDLTPGSLAHPPLTVVLFQRGACRSIVQGRMWYHVGSIEEFPTERDLHLAAIRAGLFSHRTAQQIAVIWNNNEFLFEKLIWRAAKWEPEVGPLVTADLGSVSRETFAKNIIQKQVTDEEWKEYALATLPCLSRPELRETT